MAKRKKSPVSLKISKLRKEGYPQKQAVANALSMKDQGRLTKTGGYRRSRRNRRSRSRRKSRLRKSPKRRRRLVGGKLSNQSKALADEAVAADSRGNVDKALELYTLAISSLFDDMKTSSGKDKDMTKRAIGIYLARAEELKNIKIDRELPIAPTHDIGYYTNPKDIPYMPIAPRARRKKTEVDCTKLNWSKKWCDDRSECRWNTYSNKCEFFI